MKYYISQKRITRFKKWNGRDYRHLAEEMIFHGEIYGKKTREDVVIPKNLTTHKRIRMFNNFQYISIIEKIFLSREIMRISLDKGERERERVRQRERERAKENEGNENKIVL